MRSGLWAGLARGLVVGLIGGICAGSIEGVSIIRDAPAVRSALVEAALYAVVVDGLALGGVGALLGAIVGILLGSPRSRLSSPTVFGIQLALSVFLTLTLTGLLWAFRANGAEPDNGIPVPSVLLILGLGAASAALTYAVGRPLAGLFTRTRVVASVGIAVTIMLGLVFPVQIAMESRERPATDGSHWDRLSSVDLSALPANFLDQVDASLDANQAGGRGSAGPPNVLLITVDALRADHLGFCGNDWIATPSMDMLARHSAASCNTYTQQPQTNPALASLLTSTYPAVHGVRMHMVDRLSESFDTLAKELRRSGFVTAAVLPWTSLEPAFSGLQQGFDTYEAFVLNEPPALQNPATAALAGIYRRVTNQLALGSAVESVLGLRQGTEADVDGRADISAAAAASWLTANAKSHFFLWVHYFDPHYPWTPPEPWDQLYDQGYVGNYDGGMGFVYEMRAGVFDPNPSDVQHLRALYAAEITFADHYIGRMLAHMERLGLLENTIIVLTADHGESLGERGDWWPNGGYWWPNGDYWLHGDDVYATGTQVPLIVYDPRSRQSHKVLTAPIQHVDIMPTILDLLALPIPRQAQGRSLVPLISGQESGADRIAITTIGDDSMTSIVSADGWKLIIHRGTPVQELYYLPADPEERTDLSSRFPEPAAALSRRLDAWALANQSTLTAASEDGSKI